MRLLSSSAVNVLGLLRKIQEDPAAVGPGDLSSILRGVARNVNNPRKLWDYGGDFGHFGDDVGDEEEEEEDFGYFGDEGEEEGFFDWGGDDGIGTFDAADMFPPELAECGVDGNKVMGGFLDGDIPEDFNPNEISPDFLKMFADDGEEDCTEEQEAEFTDAVAAFTSCTGWDELIEDQEALEDLVDELEEKCGAFVPSSPLEVALIDDIDFEDMDECVDVVLGDNPLGTFLRDLYHNPGKNCACVAEFGNAVPACLIHPIIPEPEFVAPGSLFKSAACLVGKACDAVEDVCLDELRGLDGCLPPLDGRKSCYKIELDCAMEGTMSLVLPPKLTEGELPDTCQKVQEEEMAGKNIPDRLSAAYHKCLEEAVEEEAVKEVAVEEEAVEEEAEPALGIAEPTEYELRGSSSTEIAEVEAEKSSQALSGIVLAAVVGLAAVAVFVARKVRGGTPDDSDPATNDFTKMPTIRAEGLEDNLVLPANTPHDTYQHQ